MVNRSGMLELTKQMKLITKMQGDPKSHLFELASEILQHPFQFPPIKKGSLNPEFLGIIPTRSCNGACIYCDFGVDKPYSGKMTYKTAAMATDWFVSLMEKHNRKSIDIHFFGGEPMMAFDVIEVVVHRARLLAAQKHMIPYFEISTNGIYSEKKARFLGSYFNKVVLSLDGTEDIQNFHRPLPDGEKSFENAIQTAHIISDSMAELCLRCCISHLNIERMEEITHWYCETFKPSVINYEVLCETPATLSKSLLPPDPYDFAINFIKSREIGKKHGVHVVYASDIGAQITNSSCPVGKDTAIFSPDGRISNCYLLPERWHYVGLDLDFGIIDKDGAIQINEQKIEAIRKVISSKPRCDRCICRWHCAGGCHVGNSYPGCSDNYDNFCIQTRIIVACSLLSALGMRQETELLLNDKESLRKLALNDSDLLPDFIPAKSIC